MDKLLFKRILVAALTILALIYVAYLLLSSQFNMYPTENAVRTTVTDTIYSNGFIIRDENIIPKDTKGILSYSCANGDTVNANGEIAKVYSDEKAAVRNTMADSIEKDVKALEAIQKNSVTGVLSLDIINNNIKNSVINYLHDTNKNDVNSCFTDSDNLLSAINQRQLFTGKVTNFNKKINELKAEAEQLRTSAGEAIDTIKTDKAGYFTEFCDGYENVYPFKDVSKMRLSNLREFKKGSVPSNIAGKVVSNVNWYVACEVSSDEASRLNIWDSAVTVLFEEATTESIPAKIYRISQDSKSGKALVVLKCDYMDNGILEARQEPIEIGLGNYTGLRVSKRAVHDDFVTKTTYEDNGKAHKEKKKVQGVYVLYGSEVQFKQISILYADEDYVICDMEPDPSLLFNGETIALYDKVIVKGDDLYDGKVIA
ncbi:MAG: HlyD family efflux transporter periplasmic adaptor subunit [Ruminococcus sp.]|nr:HlyD family efflux transporter periplasmic adaptor subunit [Ruminococcus sp.]